MNFRAKSEVCSSKNGSVMSTFILMNFLYFCTFIICSDYPYELPCEIWSLKLKNEWVIALGTKEDGQYSIYLSIFKRLYSPNFISRFLKVWTIRNTNYIVTYTFGPLELWATFKEHRYHFIVLEPKFNINTNLYT